MSAVQCHTHTQFVRVLGSTFVNAVVVLVIHTNCLAPDTVAASLHQNRITLKNHHSQLPLATAIVAVFNLGQQREPAAASLTYHNFFILVKNLVVA